MSARTLFLDALETILSTTTGLEDVRLIRSARAVGELGTTPVAQARTTQYERTPAAPLRNMTWTGTVTIASPHRDIDKAEEDLEERLELLAPALATKTFLWSDARLVDYDGQHIALDITVTAIFQKE